MMRPDTGTNSCGSCACEYLLELVYRMPVTHDSICTPMYAGQGRLPPPVVGAGRDTATAHERQCREGTQSLRDQLHAYCRDLDAQSGFNLSEYILADTRQQLFAEVVGDIADVAAGR